MDNCINGIRPDRGYLELLRPDTVPTPPPLSLLTQRKNRIMYKPSHKLPAPTTSPSPPLPFPSTPYLLPPPRQKQPIPHIPHPRPNHPPSIQPAIHTPHPHLDPPLPLRRRAAHALLAAQHGQQQDARDTPLAQGLDGGGGGAARGDDGVDEDGEVLVRGGARWRGVVVGQVVVVLHRLQGGRVAEEAEVVDGGRGREEGRERYWEGEWGVSVGGEGEMKGGDRTYRPPCQGRSGGSARGRCATGGASWSCSCSLAASHPNPQHSSESALSLSPTLSLSLLPTSMHSEGNMPPSPRARGEGGGQPGFAAHRTTRLGLQTRRERLAA